MIYAVVGPTGVGKTKFSITLAKALGNSVIINCDSMQIYKELNIGVAKIKEEEKDGIPHYLFDIKSIFDDYNAYDYQKDGRFLIDKFLKENKNIIIVGGTGLYLKALLYDYTFDDKKTNKLLYDAKIIALSCDRDKLYERINNRVDKMFEEGLLLEARNLYKQNINTRAVNTAIGYKELYEYFDNKISLEDAKEKIKQNSRRYAKRQFTFFKHQFDNICWIDIDNISLEEVVSNIKNSLH